MLEKIEQMVLDLLPMSDGKPDVDGTGSPDIAQQVLQAKGPADIEAFPSFFNKRSGEEGWHEIAVVLAKAIIQIDRWHREIIETIRSG